MYYLVVVSLHQCGLSHLLDRFVSHEKSLDPQNEWMVLGDLLGNPSLPLLTITVVNFEIPRVFAMDTIFFVHTH
jgi:hypothetical protein